MKISHDYTNVFLKDIGLFSSSFLSLSILIHFSSEMMND